VITGDEIQRFRKRLGLTQTDVAKRLQVSQQTMSDLEAGRLPVSDERLRQLTDLFKSDDATKDFARYHAECERARAVDLPTLWSPMNRSAAVTVWRWENFDLGRMPSADTAAGVILVPETERQLAAIQMPRRGARWAAGEILVFERCRPDELRDDDLCLVHTLAPRANTKHTCLAVVHRVPAKRAPRIQIKPIDPDGAVIELHPEHTPLVLVLVQRTVRIRRDHRH
jgi:transcriptional regulator with XRE-family HTH domain